MKSTFFSLLAFLCGATFLKSQNPVYRPASYAFNQDSLAGFDETAARLSAISEKFTGPELKVRMYQLKRRYINDKYNLWPSASTARKGSDHTTYALASCVNENFEASPSGSITANTAVTGWVLSGGINDPLVIQNAHSCNLLGCCTDPTSQSEIMTTPFIDPRIGAQYPVYSVFGTSTVNLTAAAASNTQLTMPLLGDKVIRINNSVNDFSIEKLSKTFSVTTANALFQFAFISVLANSHACCDAGAMQVNLYNASNGNTMIPCYSYSFSAYDNGPGTCYSNSETPVYYFQQSTSTYTIVPPGSFVVSTVIYNPWTIKTIDLTPYLNQVVTIDIVLTDCTAGGHFAYAYFDTQCGPTQIGSNGVPVTVSNNTVNIISCSLTATLAAPQGLHDYSWSGPAGFTATTSVIQTTVPGTYVLSVGQSTSCSFSTQTINLAISPASLNVTSSATVLCSGNQAVLTATGQGISSVYWDNGAITQSIAVTPTISTTYTVTGINTNGCPVTHTIAQPVSAIPAYISSSTATLCSGGTGVLTAYGLTSYLWSNGATTPSIVISPTATSVYSVSGTNGDGCFKTASITQNYVATSLSVTSTASLLCPGESATITAISTGVNGFVWNSVPGSATISVSPTVTTVYTVQGSNPQGCYAVATLTINVDNCVYVGMDQLSPATNGIMLYPNPNTGEFTLNVKKPLKNAELVIENSLGQLLFTQTVSQGENKIRLQGFAIGIYYYKVIANKQNRGQGKFKLD